jgi:hypothetical protein
MAKQFPAPIYHQRRFFPGLTEDELLTKLKDVVDRLSSGETDTSVSTGDVSTSVQQFRNLKRVKSEIEYDLHVLDPARYPKFKRIDRVRARVL